MDREHFNYFEIERGTKFKSHLRICQDKREFTNSWIEFDVDGPHGIENWYITDDLEELRKIHNALGKILKGESLNSYSCIPPVQNRTSTI